MKRELSEASLVEALEELAKRPQPIAMQGPFWLSFPRNLQWRIQRKIYLRRRK